MKINFFNILIISGVFHGLIFSVAISIIKKYRSKLSCYLASVVLFMSLHNLYYWIKDIGLGDSIPYYDHLYVPWNLLILPMYYFFVQTYFQKKKRWNQYFFIPFFISLLIHIYLLIDALIYGYTPNNYSPFVNVFYDVEEYLSMLFTVFVIVKTFYLIRINKVQTLPYQNKLQIETRWLEKILVFGIIICLFWLLLTIYSQLNNSRQLSTDLRYFVWVSISILIYWLGYLGVHQGIIYSERKHLKDRLKNIKSVTSKNNNSKIIDIKKSIENEKLFLDPNLSLSIISEKLSINENYFSSIFNQNSSDNLSTYLNKLRINEAKKILLDKEYENYTISSIGLESGFNSKSNFYKAFKKETGVSPTVFKKINVS